MQPLPKASRAALLAHVKRISATNQELVEQILTKLGIEPSDNEAPAKNGHTNGGDHGDADH